MKPCSLRNHESCSKSSFCIEKTITKGKFNVYIVYSPAQKNYYALKAFPNNPFGLKHYEKELLVTEICHSNIVKYIPTKHSSSKIIPIITEYLPHGDLFEATKRGFLDSEVIIRTYFHQMISGVECLYSNGIAHLDLKLENLMLDSDFMLKIIDFDQAQNITDEKMTSGGTEGYRAPEILKGECRDLLAADMYAVGVILYAMKARKYPFVEIKYDSKRIEVKDYEMFTKENERFWAMKVSKYEDKCIFSEEFMELVNGLLCEDVELRFKIEDIKKSKWYQGDILNDEELFIEMEKKFTGRG